MYTLRMTGRRGPGTARRPGCEGEQPTLLVCLQPEPPVARRTRTTKTKDQRIKGPALIPHSEPGIK